MNINIFIPQLDKKKKTVVRGFWVSPQGKLYYDYINIESFQWQLPNNKKSVLFYNYLDKIKAEYKQEAIFYIADNKGYIYYGNKEEALLYYDSISAYSLAEVKQSIKKYLALYKGCTVYKKESFYKIEVYYNKKLTDKEKFQNANKFFGYIKTEKNI
jgi:hypothetical protein